MHVRCSLVALLLPLHALAQETAVTAPLTAPAARAIEEWMRDYERERLGPKGLLQSGADRQPAYVQWAQRAGVIAAKDENRLTHLDVLQKLLYVATSEPSTDLARAVLAVAAAGLETSFLDPASIELRALGHAALLRTTDEATWTFLLRAAAGERQALVGDVPEPPADDSAPEPPLATPRRVAALKLLAARGSPAFRGTIDAALNDPDPPVRLAAAEAIEAAPRLDVLPRLVGALGRERHPVVSQALVRLVNATLRAGGEALEAPVRDNAIDTALRQFGRVGWRTDMDLLDLVEAWPRKDAIPVLIDALERAKSPDPLVAAVNKRASPLLRQRAIGLLRAMTGAVLPGEDPKAWRTFWEREGEHIVVPTTLRSERPETTRATFFGLPVTGSSIAFVIDTSGSMDRDPRAADPNAERRTAVHSRLHAAKEQLVAAVQAMPAESRYTVVTFADDAHVWTVEPVHPGAATTRSLTELTSRFRAQGGTNLYAGLMRALALDEQRFGQADDGRVDEIFVLTDGQPTKGDVQDTEPILKLVREANKYGKVRINTVFTGAGKGAELLRRLAEENGGVFVQR